MDVVLDKEYKNQGMHLTRRMQVKRVNFQIQISHTYRVLCYIQMALAKMLANLNSEKV